MSTILPPERRSDTWQIAGGLLLSAFIIVGGPTYAIVSEITKPRELTSAEQRAQIEAALPPLDLQQVAVGKRLYEASCIACHGQSARGVPNLGRDLVEGDYSRTVSDRAMTRLIVKGRSAGDKGFTGPVPMPPRGGRPDFTDADVAAIVAYVRALQVPARVGGKDIPEVHVELLDGPVGGETASATPAGGVASGSTGPGAPASGTSSAAGAMAVEKNDGVRLDLDPEAVKRGKRVYMSCIACHAKDGTGVKGMGADLAHSAFVKGRSDADLREFVKVGRQPGAPGSVLNLAMPPKGGNPALKDNQLDDVVTYLRWLQQQAQAK